MTDSNLRALTNEELNSIDNQTDDLVSGNIDSDQVESDRNTIQGMSAEERKLHRDYDLDVKNHYRVEAGQNSPYGNISYRVLTNNGSGFAFCEDGLNRENLQCAGLVVPRRTRMQEDGVHERKLQEQERESKNHAYM